MKPAVGICLLLCIILVPVVASSRSECTHKHEPPPLAVGVTGVGEPMILTSSGDTTWIQVHNGAGSCPGDPNLGHGGEATGGPGPTQTWCFEEGPGDSCGTTSPWDTKCFTHVDVRTLPSQTGVNFWHVDTYRADQQAYCGSYALWCGSAALWEGEPVECGTWVNPPGYGEQWNCHVQLTLPPAFSVANGCTLLFDPRYDTECKYDYFYVDYWNGTTWNTLATFNATSNNPGSPCRGTTNPDYFANTDLNRLANCNWQGRTNPDEPAFKKVITPASLIITSGPKFRWRFTSDGGWDDADGSGNTDGAAFIDNVWVWGDSTWFVEDFETGALDTAYWSKPNPPGVIDQWHVVHDPDPPYEGGDGGSRATCMLDSSYVYRARPENGYPSGKAWRNGWYYRLMTPRVPITNTGCIIQYDEYGCALDYTCDYTATRVRFHDSEYGQWCPWIGEPNWICGGGCFFWNFDNWQDVSYYYGDSADSVQYAWDVVDVGTPGDICYGKHTGTEEIVDNVSVGFYNHDATVFYTRGIDILHDSFLEGVDQAYNSFFDTYSADTVTKYSSPGRPVLPRTNQMYLTVFDNDHLASVKLVGSITKGASWVEKAMTLDVPNDPHDPTLGGDFYGTLTAGDFGGGTDWVVGTECWYYIKATDSLANVEYYPPRADPAHPAHTGTVGDYLEFSILPVMPDTTSTPKILLVDGHNRRLYDYAPCLGDVTKEVMLENIYGQTLTDAGYCYDKFDISGAGSNQHIHPVDYGDYDAVVWFTGPYFSNYLFDAEAQAALRDYLGDGGKVVLCGDRIAYNMSVEGVGEDSLGGEFLGGILGSTYVDEMPGAFTYPFAYAVPAGSVQVFGTPVAVDLDTIAVYRECPSLKDMSYVLTNASPPSGYTAQQLMYISNPTVAAADEVIYTEYEGQGQCAYVNFDLSASVNHSRGYCSGDVANPAPDFAAGTYDGRVELFRVILEDIFGLPSSGGTAGVPEPGEPVHQWSLSQNTPNPWTSATEIRYEVASSARVSIRVFNVAGQLVRTLVDGQADPGRHSVSWDGRDRSGKPVASGVYFCRMEAGSYKAARKMLVVK
jgi:hypothetical protein